MDLHTIVQLTTFSATVAVVLLTRRLRAEWKFRKWAKAVNRRAVNNRHTDHFLAPNARPANDANVNTWRDAAVFYLMAALFLGGWGLVAFAAYLLAPQFAPHVHAVQGVL